MLKTIPTQHLKESLLVLRDLKRKYKGKRQATKYAGSVGMSCPLCNFDTINHRGQSSCYCPWPWFTGKGCLSNSYHDDPVPLRLARIDRWEFEIKQEIKNRKKEE